MDDLYGAAMGCDPEHASDLVVFSIFARYSKGKPIFTFFETND
jgi:hypothetical protein